MSKKDVFHITEAAARHLRELIARRDPPPAGVRLATRLAGCSGYMYDITYVDEPGTDDIAVETAGITLFIDAGSLPYVKGTVMDWQEGRFETGFTFDNPNAAGLCGCGESFTIEEKAG